MHTIPMKSLPGRSRAFLRPSRSDFGRQITVVLTSVWRILFVWQSRSNQRHALGGLEQHRLDDIGLTPGNVAHEIAKPFWRA